MIRQSIIEERGFVSFPEYTGERAYMVPFMQDKGLPDAFGRWQNTVDQMLDGIQSDYPIYLMIDQSFVAKNNTHRRAGLHIDGYWNDSIRAHRTYPIGHEPVPSPIHHPLPQHSPSPSRHVSNSVSWNDADYSAPEAIMLASNVSACRGYVGQYDGYIGEMGDCSAINTDHLSSFVMDAGKTYAGNVNCLHESLPLYQDQYRTLVRLNIPGWSPR